MFAVLASHFEMSVIQQKLINILINIWKDIYPDYKLIGHFIIYLISLTKKIESVLLADNRNIYIVGREWNGSFI